MEVSIKATIDDLNQYLQGNVTAQGLIDTLEDLLNFLKDSEGISENKTMENLNEGKKAKGYMAELAEIDKQSALVALEAKINKLAEMAEAKTNRLSMVNEDENLSELISKQAVKEMQRSIKEIEKLKEKLLKEFTKKGGKMTEVIDEEMDDTINPGNTKDDQAKKDAYDYDARPAHMKEEEMRDEKVEEEMRDEKVEEEMRDEKVEERNISPSYEEDGSERNMEEEMKDDDMNEEIERFKKLAGL